MSTAPSQSGEAPAPSYRYWGFISYSHRDTAWAERLHTRLETWRVPAKLVGHETPQGKIPSRLYPIFRDRDEISGGNLDDVITAALNSSRFLIVVCSPFSAASKYVNEEIRIFKMLGREERIIYFIVGGDPAGDESLDPTTGQCFPPVAHQRIAADGAATSGRLEPAAADVRPGKDGWSNAFLKVLAMLLSVGLEDLKLRELKRRQHARLVAILLTAGTLLLLFLAYIAAADAGLNAPRCESVRLWLDRYDASIFRRVPGPAEIRTAGLKLEEDLTAELLRRPNAEGLIPGGHSQAVAALASNYLHSTMERPALVQLRRSVEFPFRSKAPIVHDGPNWGWAGRDPALVESLAPLWTCVALGEMLGPPMDTMGLKNKIFFRDSSLRERLAILQDALRPYHTGKDPGGWNMVPFQVDPDQHSVYASTVALMALTECRRAHEPWEGSEENRDRLLHQTALWLVGQYHLKGARHGWINDTEEEHINDVYDGLTAQTYAALLEAEWLDKSLTLSDSMHADIYHYLVGCVSRTAEYAIDVGEYHIDYHPSEGTTRTAVDSLRYLWWPWVIRCADGWLKYADQHHLPHEQKVRVRRTLAHLVLDLGPQEVGKGDAALTYVLSEDLVCLRKSFPAQ